MRTVSECGADDPGSPIAVERPTLKTSCRRYVHVAEKEANARGDLLRHLQASDSVHRGTKGQHSRTFRGADPRGRAGRAKDPGAGNKERLTFGNRRSGPRTARNKGSNAQEVISEEYGESVVSGEKRRGEKDKRGEERRGGGVSEERSGGMVLELGRDGRSQGMLCVFTRLLL